MQTQNFITQSFIKYLKLKSLYYVINYIIVNNKYIDFIYEKITCIYISY